jgi:hypothetical protein
MDHFAGLDVSVKETSICIVDDTGELNVSKNSFDFGWNDAIEKTGRRDWYEPLPRRSRTKS